MKADQMKEIGFTEKGIEKFLSIIKSVLPHAPGDWDFIDTDSKLQYVAANKEVIEEYLKNAKPQFSDEECKVINWLFDTDDTKIKRLSEIQSASQALSSYF